MAYSDVNLSGIDSMRFRIASNSTGGTLELRAGSATGELLGSVPITNTGGGQAYEWFDAEVTDPGEPFDLVLVFLADHGDYIANINFFEVVGDGVTVAAPDPVEATPAAVTFSDEHGTYVVPVAEGVEYVVDGVVVPAGTHEGSGTVTVTARALAGFVLAEGVDVEWSFTFSTEPDPEPEPEPDDRGAEFHLSNGWRGVTDVFFKYGRWADNILIGDWNGDGVDTLAVRRGAVYHVKNSLRGGDADVVFTYGREDDQVLVGDWNGDGTDTFTVRRDAVYHVKNSLRGGDADATFTYGRSTDVTHVGDWDGNGTDAMAVQRGRVFHVNNSLRGGDADIVVTFGRLGDEVYVGDWDGNGTDTRGICRPIGGHTTAVATAGGEEVGSAI